MQAHADYIAQPQSVASQAALFSTMGINDLQKAAKAGQAGAQFYLGTHYQYGKDVAKDDKQAFAWFKAAADQGLSPAQLNVGRMYADGIGVKKDFKTAITLYTKVAKQNESKLLALLAKERINDLKKQLKNS